MKKFKVLKVIVEEQYLIEMYDDEHTCINGWSITEVIKSWFKDFPLGQFHASRDAALIGGSRKYISSEVEEIE